MPTHRPVVFLDRDDTLLATNEATANLRVPGDLLQPDLVRLLPGAGQACRRLIGAGYPLVLITNQGGVARGMGTLADAEATNDTMRAQLAALGVTLAGVYYCPFASSGHVVPFNVDHDWRKPGAGMYGAASAELGIDLARSWSIGDKARDVEAAVAGGVPRERCFLIATSGATGAHAPDLLGAVDLLLSRAQV
jgi:D-glycero-D-manno-heptose 1,7-bisphosphate phosphatase